MSTKKIRPTLDSLASRFAPKAASAAAVGSPAPAIEPAPSSEAQPVKAGSRDDRVQILTRIDAATRKRLKLIAVEQDRTIQDICEEAIRDFVARHSR